MNHARTLECPPPSTLVHKTEIVVYLKLVMVSLLWGGTFIAGHVLAAELPRMSASAFRFAVALILLLALCWKTYGGLPRLSGQQFLSTVMLGITGIFLYNYCFIAALSSMPAGRASLLVALGPVMTAIVLATVFGERLGLMRWAGIVLSVLGAAIIISHGDLLAAFDDLSSAFGSGERYLLVSIASWTAYTIIGKKTLQTLSPLVATTYAALWGFLFLLCGAFTELPELRLEQFLSWRTLGAAAYLGALGTVVAFTWYYEGIRELGATRAAIFTNLVPVFGVFFATTLLGEALHVSMLIGGAIVIYGVTLTNRR